MAVNEEDVALIRSSLQEGETVDITARQRRLGPGGSILDPATIIITNRRVVIINRSTFSFRKEFEYIPYAKIVSVRMERGITCSSLLIRVQGATLESKPLREGLEEGFVDGLSHRDAEAVSERIEKWRTADENGRKLTFKRCPDCGVKNILEARYCVNCGATL